VRTSDRRGVLMFAISGMLTISAQMCVIAAMRYAPVAVVALITLCTPLIVFPLSYFLLKNQERIGAITLAGGALVLAGIAVLILQ
jgi:drug/metabolite transporter (DMT)-like permease